MFAFLAQNGVAREDLQLVWDFTTSTDEHNTARMVLMIDAGLAELGTGVPSYTIIGMTDRRAMAAASFGTGTVMNLCPDTCNPS